MRITPPLPKPTMPKELMEPEEYEVDNELFIDECRQILEPQSFFQKLMAEPVLARLKRIIYMLIDY